MRSIAACLAATTMLLAGCGVKTPDFSTPSIPKFTPHGGAGSATFSLDGQTIIVQQTGHVTVSIGSAPQITYSGPLGCKGRYFTGHLTEHIQVVFRYSARDAYFYVGTGDLYHFPTAPRRAHGALVWDHRFSDRHISVIARCPPPPRGSGPLSRLG
jgi:hypothetical protein